MNPYCWTPHHRGAIFLFQSHITEMSRGWEWCPFVCHCNLTGMGFGKSSPHTALADRSTTRRDFGTWPVQGFPICTLRPGEAVLAYLDGWRAKNRRYGFVYDMGVAKASIGMKGVQWGWDSLNPNLGSTLCTPTSKRPKTWLWNLARARPPSNCPLNIPPTSHLYRIQFH